jgi:hypothetical protein
LGAILSDGPEMRKMPYKTCMMILYVEIITACEAHLAQMACLYSSEIFRACMAWRAHSLRQESEKHALKSIGALPLKKNAQALIFKRCSPKMQNRRKNCRYKHCSH